MPTKATQKSSTPTDQFLEIHELAVFEREAEKEKVRNLQLATIDQRIQIFHLQAENLKQKARIHELEGELLGAKKLSLLQEFEGERESHRQFHQSVLEKYKVEKLGYIPETGQLVQPEDNETVKEG